MQSSRTPPILEALESPHWAARLRAIARSLRLGAQTAVQAAPRHLTRLSIALLAAGVIAALRPSLYAQAIDALLVAANTGDFGPVTKPAMLLLGLTGLATAFGLVRSYDSDQIAERVAGYSRESLARSASRIPLIDFEDSQFLGVLDRATSESAHRPFQLITGVHTLATGIVTAVGYAAGLGLIAPVAVPFLVVLYLPIAWSHLRRSREDHRFLVENTRLDRERMLYASVLSERRSAPDIRSFRMGAILLKWLAALNQQKIDRLGVLKRRQSLHHALTLLLTLVVAIPLAYWLLTNVRTEITAVLSITTAFVLLSLYGSIGQAYLGFSLLHQASIYLADYERVTRYASSLPNGVTPGEAVEHLFVDNVSFRYPGATSYAIKGIDLQLTQGKMLGIVGENGAGKTTLAKVISGLLPASKGTVSYEPESATGIPMLGQSFLRLPISLFKNVALGAWADNPSEDQVRAALEQVGLGALVESLPNGLETLIGRELGGDIDLSFGQWQRVGLARALLGAHSMLILDEPFAALDPDAEASLSDAIHAFRRSSGVVLISHRLASVRSADEIIVLRQGELIERGSHLELMALKQEYHRLFRLQAQRYG